jgi:PPP family 3-phenylpropionic acid transporter
VTIPPTHSTKPQYFLSFAVLGSIVPFASVLLAERGLSKAQIGTAWAVQSVAVIVTPIVVTLLADLAVPARVLLGGLFALAGLALAGLAGAQGFWPILVFYALHNVALQPVFPLQDGVFFASQAARRAAGLKEVAYPHVRVMGTIGYILPSVVLYFWLRGGGSMTPVLGCGIVFCAISAAYAVFWLPGMPPGARAGGEQARGRLPTAAAARALGEPHVLVFCVAVFLLMTASQAYYAFYPLHLTERCGVAARDVGLIANVGTAGEIVYMYAFGWLARVLTIRRLMYVGALAATVRYVMLAYSASTGVAIGTQALHGLMILAMGVAPPIFLNARAEDAYRNSMQGLYTMLVIGGAKVIGGQMFGRIAERGLAQAFYVAGGLCLAATVLLFFAFHEKGEKAKT